MQDKEQVYSDFVDEYKNPNILEYIDMMMEEGYSEDDAARMWFCLFADTWDEEE